MKTLYLDCNMGAAGDMLTAALLELIPDREGFLTELNNLGIPGIKVFSEKSSKCGIQGTHVLVTVNDTEETENMHDMQEHSCENSDSHIHKHSHNGIHEIEHIVNTLPVSDGVKKEILMVYSMIAKAESHVHGMPVDKIHFHEVGAMDAIADVTAVCMLMERLAPDQVIVSPVQVGNGHVKCAHGILPVPAPATAFILKDIPIYNGEIQSELCTPTGAALLKYFATKFGNMPIMKTTGIGYGMGKKDFAVANCVRAMIGDTEETGDVVVELCCNLDDMTAEALAFAKEQFFIGGALDVYTVSAQMKKSRPGILLNVMCREEDKEKMVAMIFKHTTTLGVRENISRRYILSRTMETVQTEWGNVQKKVSTGYGVTREKYEYEDIARIAREQNISFENVMDHIRKSEF